MPLYVRDETVNQLVEKVVKKTGAKNKTEAVRFALLALIGPEEEEKKSLLEDVQDLQAKADIIGVPDPGFNIKKFTDRMWEND